MRHTDSFRRLAAVLVAWALLSAVSPARAGSPASDGWQSLWANQNAAARTAFVAALHHDPSDETARRGLGWLAEQEDNPAAALQAWRPLYRLAPGHWAATALWPEMVRLTEDTGRWDILAGAARDVLASPAAAAPLRASARLALAHQAMLTGDKVAAGGLWDGLRYVRAWKVIGPFDNVSKSGFDKAWPPEQMTDTRRSCIGKDGQTLQWHPLALAGPDGKSGVGQSLGDGEPDVFYAATSLYSPREQAVTFQLSTEGAAKVFLNGRVVFTDPIYRPWPDLVADVFPVSVRLQAGWNTVLVKTADDDNLTAAFSLRITTPGGADLPAFKSDPARTILSVSPSPEASLPLAETATAALLRQKADDLEATDALASELRATGDYTGATEAARADLARAPHSAWLHWQLSQALKSDDQLDEARAECRAACDSNPQLLPAALAALDEQSESLAPAEYVQQLKGLLAVNPQSADVLWDLADAYDKVKLTADALRTAHAAERAAPGSDAVLSLVRVLRSHDRNPEAQHVLVTALAMTPNDPDLLERWASLLANQGQTQTAIGIYRRLSAQGLADPRDRAALAELYQSQQNLAAAAQVLRVARQERPQDGDVCASLADVAHGLGNKKEAVRLLDTAIALNPSAVALREERQVLLGEKPIVDLAPATPGQPLVDKARTLGVQGASAVVVLDEGREVVYPDYATVTRYHQIVKIGDAAAVERFSQYPLVRPTASSRLTLESARLVKANGKVQDVTDQADDDNPTSVALPSLAPGDTVDVAYRVEDYARGGLAHQFWANWLFSFNGAPVKQSRFVLVTPTGMPLQTQAHGAVPPPSDRDVPGWHIREWHASEVPPFKRQTLGTTLLDSGSWLDVSSIRSWSDVVRWYRALSGPRCVPDAAIRTKALDLTKGAVTETDKLHAIVSYVRSLQYQTTPFRLSAYVPTEGKQVIREQYGDCKDKAALLTSLLDVVGIRSEMVLLSPRDYGLAPYLPSPRFNHAIARVQTAQGPLWVDATADQMAFGDLPYDDQQVPALVIDDATTDLTTTPLLAPEHNGLENDFQGALAADGTLSGGLVMTGEGNWGWIFHTLFKQVPQDKQEEALRSMTGSLMKNAVYESGALDNVTDPDLPIVLRLKYHLEGYSAAADNFLLLRLPWENGTQEQALESLRAETSQGQDLDLALLRGHYVSKMRLQLPTGFVPQNLGPGSSAQTPFGSYRISYRMEGDSLVAERDLTLTSARVSAGDLPQLLAFLHNLNQETAKQFVFKKS